MRCEHVSLWGKKFNLSVAYDYYDEPVPVMLIAEVDSLLENWRAVEDSKSAVRAHCMELDGSLIEKDFGSAGSVEITEYVSPTHLVGLDNEDVRCVALLCDYRYDPEEGLALVFVNERLSEITTQSDCL